MTLTGVYFKPSSRRNAGDWVAVFKRDHHVRHVTLPHAVRDREAALEAAKEVAL